MGKRLKTGGWKVMSRSKGENFCISREMKYAVEEGKLQRDNDLIGRNHSLSSAFHIDKQGNKWKRTK
jgi:hypothetical protein